MSNNNNNNNNNWKRVGGFSRTGTQNYVRTNDAAMGGTTFGPTDISYNTGNTTMRIGNNAGVVFINGDIDMSGGPGVGAPINRVRNVRDPIADQDVATKFYVDKTVTSLLSLQAVQGPPGEQGPPGIGFAGQNGSDGPTGATGCTGAIGPPGPVIGVTGATGSNGATGATGANGPAGVTGPIGPIGAKGDQGIQGIQGIQGSNGTILWLNPDGDSTVNQLITDSYMLSTVPIISSMRTIGPISVSATYGNANKMIPGNRFWNTAQKVSTLAVIPSGVWVLNLYANVPSTSDANQVSLYAGVFMISGTLNQPSPDSLIIETKDGGDAGFYPPRAAYLPDHVKYIGKSWTNTDNVFTDSTTDIGAIVNSTTRKLYKIEIPVEFITLKDASGNSDNVYIQLQIYIKNTKAANQTANVILYYQTDLNTNVTTYSYLQTTFGAVGIQGIQGTTGPIGLQGSAGATGPAGAAGSTGSVGPTGTTGSRGPEGPLGPTGPTGVAGQSNSVGRQYTVQYRANAPQGNPNNDSDMSGSFAGNANFRFLPSGSAINATDASLGTLVLNDIACNSVHSSFYVEDPSITGNNTRPRTFVKGGESNGGYVVLASGKNTAGDGGTTSSPANVSDITHGIKLIHNIDGNPPTATLNLHNNSKSTSIVGMKFDLTNGNVIAAKDQFCIVNTSGAVGVGGITPDEMTAVGQSGLNRTLHVRGNVMVGTHPGAGATEASSAMIMLNKATTTPTTPLSSYPGVYHRSVAAGSETTALGGATNSITAGTQGLGVISPNFITFQTGSSLQNNSIVINQSGDVSVTGRTNLNGAVSVGRNFAAVTNHPSVGGVAPIMDVSGVIHIGSAATSYADNPRMKLISTVIGPNSDIPSISSTTTANEIRGVAPGDNTGFLRLTAQTPANSCIDLVGTILSGNATIYNNSVRISTGGSERMIINGSGNVGIGTTPVMRLDVAGGQSRMNSGATTNTALTTTGRVGVNNASPGFSLDITGDARMNSGATTNTALTTTGRVGVNNASPIVPLDVTGAARITGNLDMNGTGRITNLLNPDNPQEAATKSYVDTGVANATAGGVSNPAFQPRSATVSARYLYPSDGNDAGIITNATTRLHVTSSGNIGINTTSPSVLLDVVGAAKISGNLDMNNAGKIIQLLNPTNAQDAATKSYVDTSIPIGGIIMWSGAGFTLPSNWKLCDGTTYGSVVTPNLIGRFVKGASSLGVSRLENNSVGTGDIIKAGNDILGNLSYEYFGASVSISADGTTVAVGAYGNNGFTGVTRVYKYNATGEWSQLGPTISGVDYGEQSGYSVSLSADGTTLAVGAYGNNGFTGVTRVYKYNATTGQWPQLGSTISGVDNGERSGAGVSISADGTTVAVGAYLNSTYKGVTRVYRYNGSTWPQLGPNILGDGTQELSGHSVSLSADGTTVAVGAYGNSSYKGVTRVYRYNGSTWPQLGPTISGVDNEEQSGYSVSLSADGNTVAVGAFGNGDNKGVTRIYRYNATTGQWPQFGQNILGDGTVEYFGYSVSISADGNTVAVGAQQANNTRGVTRVYKYNATTSQWPQLGPNILGDGTVEQSGYSVSISADGTTVAVGAPNNSSGRGVTRVYLFSNIYVLAFIMRVS